MDGILLTSIMECQMTPRALAGPLVGCSYAVTVPEEHAVSHRGQRYITYDIVTEMIDKHVHLYFAVAFVSLNLEQNQPPILIS